MKPQTFAAILLVLALPLAGCISSSDAGGLATDTPAGPQADDTPPASTTVPRAPPTSWGLTDCHAFVGIFAVPVGPVRALVPSDYHILGEEGGKAGLAAAVNVCDDMSIDGASVGPASVSEVAVAIAAPDNTGGVHQYMLWMSTTSQEVHDAFAALGIGGNVEEETLDIGSGLPGGTISGTAGYNGTYELHGTSVTPGVPFLLPGTYWHKGPKGEAIIVCQFEGTSVGGARASVVAEAGSPLAELLGGTSADGGGPLVANYGGTAQITFR